MRLCSSLRAAVSCLCAIGRCALNSRLRATSLVPFFVGQPRPASFSTAAKPQTPVGPHADLTQIYSSLSSEQLTTHATRYTELHGAVSTLLGANASVLS